MFLLYHVTLEEASRNGNLGTRYVYISVEAECGMGRVGGRKAANNTSFNPLKPELNPICYLLALLGAHHFLHVSRIRVKLLALGY